MALIVDLGDVPVGQRVDTTVTLSHCGEPGDTILAVGVDGTVDPVGALADFTVPPESNACHPALGDGESIEIAPGEWCDFVVEFIPMTAGEHQAEITFPSNTQPERHRIEVGGSGLGGSLSFSIQGLPEIPEFLCFDAPANPCTPERTARLSNGGPGAVTLFSGRIDTLDPDLPPGFAVDPTIEAPATESIGAGDDFDFSVRWCSTPDAQDRARLVVDSNDPQRPTSILELRRLADCPDGS